MHMHDVRLIPDEHPEHGRDCDHDPCAECLAILADQEQERLEDYARETR